MVAGLLGGGVAYAGLSQINGQNAPQTTVAPTAKVEKSNSKNSSQMTNAFNTVKNSVVSVVNLKRQSSSSTSDPFGIFGSDSSSSSKKNSKSDLETYSEGSGVIYMKSNGKGYIVTNNQAKNFLFTRGNSPLRVMEQPLKEWALQFLVMKLFQLLINWLRMVKLRVLN